MNERKELPPKYKAELPPALPVEHLSHGVERGLDEIEKMMGKKSKLPLGYLSVVLGLALPLFALTASEGVKKPWRKRVVVYLKRFVGKRDSIWEVEPMPEEQLRIVFGLSAHLASRAWDMAEKRGKKEAEEGGD